MTRDERRVLAVNAGSSSITFALCRMAGAPERVLRGSVDRVELAGTKLTFEDAVPDDGSTGERGTSSAEAARAA